MVCSDVGLRPSIFLHVTLSWPAPAGAVRGPRYTHRPVSRLAAVGSASGSSGTHPRSRKRVPGGRVNANADTGESTATRQRSEPSVKVGFMEFQQS